MEPIAYSIQDEQWLMFLENGADLVVLPSIAFLVKILWLGELLVIMTVQCVKKVSG